jgi:hypothetical protein
MLPINYNKIAFKRFIEVNRENFDYLFIYYNVHLIFDDVYLKIEDDLIKLQKGDMLGTTVENFNIIIKKEIRGVILN